MKKSKKGILLAVFASLSLMTAACSAPADVVSEKKVEPKTEQVTNDDENPEEKIVQVKESELNNVKSDIETKAKYITTLEKELKYYKEYVISMTNLMPETEKQKIIEKEWNYSLTVNGIGFPTNGILQVNATDFEVILTEEKAPYSVLSEEDQQLGKLKTAVEKAMTSKTGEMKFLEEEHKKQVVINYAGVQSGDEIMLKVNQNLQEKLGFEKQELIIQVK